MSQLTSPEYKTLDNSQEKGPATMNSDFEAIQRALSNILQGWLLQAGAIFSRLAVAPAPPFGAADFPRIA